MSDDPIDRLGARLFEVARKEQPPQGAQQRALDAARPLAVSRSTTGFAAWRDLGPKLLIWAAALGLVIGLVAFARLEQPATSIRRESLPTPSQARVSDPAVAPPPSARATASAETRPAPRAVAMPVRSQAVTLSDELELLKVAQTALATGNTQVALQALDRYDRSAGSKKLKAEATLLRVETLSRSGRTEAAAELARHFIAENPTNPLADRARSFIHEGK